MKWIGTVSTLALVALITLTGCGKKSDAEASAGGGTPELVDATPLVPGVAPGTMIQTKLTGAVHAYREANGRWPSDFDELVTAKLLDKVPAPPPGKQFVFDKKSLQVLVVPQ